MVPRLHAAPTHRAGLRRAWLGPAYPENADTAPLLVLAGPVRPAGAGAMRLLRDLADSLAPDAMLVGARLRETADGRGRPDDDWAAHLADWGGCGASANAAGIPCPAPGAALLGRAAAAGFLQKLAAGHAVPDALAALATERDHWRHDALDTLPAPRPRVLQVIAGLQLGGAERLAVALTDGLRHFDYDTRLAVIGRTVRTPCPAPAGTLHFHPLGDRETQARAVAAYAASGAFDLIHAHLLDGDELRLLAAAGVPVLTTAHNTREGWPAGLVDAPATLVACAEAVARQLRESPAAAPRVIVAENPALNAGAPRPGRVAARERLGVPANALVLAAIANFRPQKRLDRLPAVAAAVAGRRAAAGEARPVHLLVAGEAASPACAPLVAGFDAEAARHAGRVATRRLGAVPDPADLLAAADALVSVSEHEGSSLAQLEALAAGVPVVATAVGAAPDVAARCAGLVVVPPDAAPAAFADALDRLLGPGARAWAPPADFTPHAWLARHDFLYTREILRAALAGRGGRAGFVFVTNNLAPGGAQSGLRRLALELRDRGHPVAVALLLESPDHPTPGTAALRAAGIPVTPLTPAVAGVDALDALKPLVEKLAAEPPRAVFLWNALPEAKVALAEALAGALPVIDASPGEMFYASLDRYFKNPRPGSPVRDARAYAALLARVVVKYAGEAPRARAELGVEPAVILNGVPGPARREKADTPAEAGPVVATLARLAPQKKLEELLTAFRLLLASGARARLRIAGDPEHDTDAYAEALRASVADLPVEWVGHREDTAAFLGEADIFALVAEPEGCPNASLEALAAGLPVVATAAGAIPEQIRDGVTGLVTPRADPPALADALARLVNDRELRHRLGEAARADAATRFSVARMADDYLRVAGR